MRSKVGAYTALLAAPGPAPLSAPAGCVPRHDRAPSPLNSLEDTPVARRVSLTRLPRMRARTVPVDWGGPGAN